MTVSETKYEVDCYWCGKLIRTSKNKSMVTPSFQGVCECGAVVNLVFTDKRKEKRVGENTTTPHALDA